LVKPACDVQIITRIKLTTFTHIVTHRYVTKGGDDMQETTADFAKRYGFAQ